MPQETHTQAQSKWKQVKWILPFLAAFLPIVLLSVYTLRVASDSVRDLVHAENLSAVSNIAQLITRDVTESVGLLNAFASVPGTVKAIEERDEFTLRTRLKAITVAAPRIHRAYVLDTDGILWGDYPTASGAYGKDLSSLEWFQAVTETNKITLSSVYLEGAGESVVAMVSPSLSEEGGVVGIVVFEYRVAPMSEWLSAVELTHGGNVLVLDHTGTLVAHPTFAPQKGLFEGYSAEESVQAALAGSLHTEEYSDPLSGKMMLATFLPLSVGRNQWVIVAQQPKALAYAEVRRIMLGIGVVGGVLTLMTLMLVVGLARMSARNIRLNRELTEKNIQLSEAAAIVRSSNDAIIGLSLDRKITSWNEAAEQMYGFAAQEAVGSFLDAIVPDEQKKPHGDMLRKLGKGKSIKHFETVHIRKDKELIPISITFSPVKDEAGVIVGASATCRDITERKKLEQMKDDFIGFVSHQLKAPITALNWNLEMILGGDYGEVSDALHKPLEEMQTVVDQNKHLVGEILNASRIDRGVIRVDLKPLSLKEIAERALQNYRIPIQEKGLKLKEEGWDQEVMVMADLEKSAEAISNSVSNAIKHTEQGSITVSLSSEEKFGVVKVSDTGEGMDTEATKNLFTRDKILGGSSKAEKSAGLGLYIAKHFMTLQRGDISVESKKGEGSIFIYTLPLVHAKTRKIE